MYECMNELPRHIQESVRKYKPIVQDGHALFPVLVSEYTEFLIARPALEVMHQSLPVALLRLPLLSALYQMDFDAVASGKTPTGLFLRARLALALSLRLGVGREIVERVELLRIVVDRENPRKLKALRYMDKDGQEKDILPGQYKELRRIIAAQNGVKLESDDANPDIVKAKKDMASAGGLELDYSVENLVSAISALTQIDEDSIFDWPILKLEKQKMAWERILTFMVCGVGEASGATWKNGNPVPHPFFPRISDGGIFSPLGSESGGTKVPEVIRESAAITSKL